MNETLRTIKGLCDQAAREPEKERQCLDMIVTLIRFKPGKKPSKRLREMSAREHERAHRRRAVAARETDRHLAHECTIKHATKAQAQEAGSHALKQFKAVFEALADS